MTRRQDLHPFAASLRANSNSRPTPRQVEGRTPAGVHQLAAFATDFEERGRAGADLAEAPAP